MESIRKLCESFHVKSLYAFGSAAKGDFKSKSDVDLLVSFLPLEAGDYADNYFLLAEELEKLFKRPVDLITDRSLSNPYFIDSVNETKVMLYG